MATSETAPAKPKKTPSKPKQETWLDWGSPDDDRSDGDLFTRDELIELLAPKPPLRRGDPKVPVTAGDLRYWEGAGILPRAIKRWHEESRSVRALYPFTAVLVIRELRQLQEAGYSLDQISRILRARAQTRHLGDPYGLFPAIQEAVRRRVEQTGEPVAIVRVQFEDASGHEEPFWYDFRPDASK